jgi:GTP-binding protein
MNIKKVLFVISNTNYKHCPIGDKAEYAFIGRSNVGKSSLINSIANNKSLAKTSRTPGKTQLINHFIINDNWYLVDLPGYGYAKTSKVLRAKFHKMISDYLINRLNLICLFVLIDSRHDLQDIDRDFMQWLAENKIAFSIIFTKSDKLSKNKLEKTLSNFKKKMLFEWKSLPDIFITSSHKREGLKEILIYISKLNLNYKPNL